MLIIGLGEIFSLSLLYPHQTTNTTGSIAVIEEFIASCDALQINYSTNISFHSSLALSYKPSMRKAFLFKKACTLTLTCFSAFLNWVHRKEYVVKIFNLCILVQHFNSWVFANIFVIIGPTPTTFVVFVVNVNTCFKNGEKSSIQTTQHSKNPLAVNNFQSLKPRFLQTCGLGGIGFVFHYHCPKLPSHAGLFIIS